MTTQPVEARCPYCGSSTPIPRAPDPRLGDYLSIEEFELLVRGDWRRILGRDAYDRAHEARIVGTFVALVAVPDADAAQADLRAEVDQLIADLASTGAGREAVRTEVQALFHAMDNVLSRVGAPPRLSAGLRTSATQAIEEALGYSLGPPAAAPYGSASS